MSVIEVTVVLKDSERTYRQKFLHYDELLLSVASDAILQCIKEAQENFQGIPDDVIIKTSMTV
jgi:hypothetical protein